MPRRRLAAQPPSVVDDIEREEQRLAYARERLDALQRAKPGWKPTARRQFTEKVGSTERAIARHEDRLAELQAQQGVHDAFAVEHAAKFEQARILTFAASARRLTVRIAPVADPPLAALDLVGPRPTSQPSGSAGTAPSSSSPSTSTRPGGSGRSEPTPSAT